MIKTIIFDVYGTLISTGTGSIDACQEILSDLGVEDVDPKVFYSEWKKIHRINIDSITVFKSEEAIFRMDLKELFKRYNIRKDADFFIHHMLNSLKSRKPFTDTNESLNNLSQNYSLYIGSTSDHQPLLNSLSGFIHLFKDIHSSETLNTYKPQKEFYLKILSSNNLIASECLFVGDSIVDDIIGPSACGINVVLLNRKNEKQIKYPQVSSLNDIEGYIRSLDR